MREVAGAPPIRSARQWTGRNSSPFHLLELDFYTSCHTLYGMKMTMHIDEHLLKRVMAQYGFASKTETVETALKELDRRIRLEAFVSEPVEWEPDELKNAVAPGYDPIAMRVAESSGYYGHDPKA